MLGYISNNNDYFKGNLLQHNLKKAVSYSGGNKSHYEFFSSLLTYSIYNNSQKIPLHDARAGEFLLHLFPIKIQVLLSLLFYYYEVGLLEQYSDYALESSNILLPSQQLQFNNIINKSTISSDLLLLSDDVASSNNTLNDIGMAQLKQILNITFSVNDLDGTILQNIERLLSKFRVASILKSQYIGIVKDNSRLDAAIITARKLNYKTQSSQYLTEAISIWLQNSNT